MPMRIAAGSHPPNPLPAHSLRPIPQRTLRQTLPTPQLDSPPLQPAIPKMHFAPHVRTMTLVIRCMVEHRTKWRHHRAATRAPSTSDLVLPDETCVSSIKPPNSHVWTRLSTPPERDSPNKTRNSNYKNILRFCRNCAPGTLSLRPSSGRWGTVDPKTHQSWVWSEESWRYRN